MTNEFPNEKIVLCFVDSFLMRLVGFQCSFPPHVFLVLLSLSVR